MKRWFLPVAILVAMLGIGGFLARDMIRPKVAGLKVEAEPAAAVYVNGSQVGNTPYSSEMTPGEVDVKLVPLTTVTPLAPYEEKVKLVMGVQTVVRRWFGTNEEVSSGEVLSLEKYEAKDKTSGALVVIPTPDAAAVRLNGVLKGFTPLVQDGVPAGEYQLAVVAPGWRERMVTVKVEASHRLNVTVKLAREEGSLGAEEALSASGSAQLGVRPTVTPTGTVGRVSPTPTKKEEVKRPYVEIGETPTGWLRVREEAAVTARELARVDQGERFPFLEKTTNGWYKILYAEGKEGWVAAQYADLVE